MKSSLKILVPVVLLLGGVFGITYLMQYTPPGESDKKDSELVTARKPLQFFTSRRAWLPRQMYDEVVASGDTPPNLFDTVFPGFYEPGVEHNSASFWFKSDNSVPVDIQLQGVSCVSCSGGRVAAIPPAVADQILQMAALSVLPQGFASGLPAGMAGPAANLDPARLPWQYHKFDKPKDEIKYEIPKAPAGAGRWCAEQWAILDLQFQARPVPGQHSFHARFQTRRQNETEAFEEEFAIAYVTSNPFELDKTAIDVGELSETSPGQTHEILAYSCTRSNLAEMELSVRMPPGAGGEAGPFVSVGKPVPVPESRYLALMTTISTAKKQPVRFRSAFTIPVTIVPKVGEAKLDFGQLDRNVIARLGTVESAIRVTGSMRGPIYLVGAKEIAFGYFSYTNEQTVTVTVESERGVELQLLPGLTQPKFLKVDLQRQPDIGDRRIYKLKAVLPAREQLGEINDGVVVLESKGANPLRLRIPVTGRGR